MVSVPIVEIVTKLEKVIGPIHAPLVARMKIGRWSKDGASNDGKDSPLKD